METAKTSNFTCQSNSFISIFFTCQVSACELQPFSCHNLANDLYSETAKTVFSHLNMHVDARAQDEIRKRQFSEVPKWGNRRRWDLNLGQFGENGEGGGCGG